MRWRSEKSHVLFTWALGLVLCASAFGADIPEPSSYVEDHAGIIDAEHQRALNGYLQELEQKTTCQIIVLTVGSTEGVPISRFAIQLARKWQLGQKDKNNGALIVVAVKDKKYRIEVGYGLEGPLPDSFVGTIGRRHFVPNFRRGQYGKGLFEGTVAIINRVAEEYNVEVSGVPKVAPQRSRPGGEGGLAYAFFAIIVFFFLIVRFGMWPFIFLPLFGGYGGRYWGGGGYSGGFSSGGSFGGFGGFGGGGGGSFGGGGASGGW